MLAGFILSVGPLCGEQVLGGMQFSVVVIVPKRDGKDCASSQIRLDIAQDPFMAHVYRTALIVALEEFFGRVQIFGNELTLAKYCHGVTIIIQLHTRSIVMALTSAEKQQHYRERHLGVRTKDRIQLFISVQAKAQLRRLARHHGCTV